MSRLVPGPSHPSVVTCCTSTASDKHWGEKAGMETLGRGLLTPAFVTCSTNTGVRRPGYKGRQCLHLSYPHSGMLMSQIRFIHCK